MRIFIALPLPLEFKKRLLEIIRPLRLAHPQFKWQDLGQLHLSLAFLGELDEKAVIEATRCLRKCIIASGIHAFPLALDTLLCFPPQGPIRIVSAAVSEGASDCTSLAAALELALEESGDGVKGLFRPRDNKPYLPHITLARVKDGFLTKNERATRLRLMTTITGAAVYASTLSPSGSMYRILTEYSFSKEALS